MKNIKHAIIGIIITFLLVLSNTPYISYADESKTVKVGWFYLPGYMEKKEDGTYSGYIYDYLMKIKEYTGWDYKFVEGSHSSLFEKLKNEEIDIFAPIAPMGGYDEDISFTRLAIGEESLQLFTSVDSKLARNDYSSFDNITVAVSSDKVLSRFESFENEHGFNVKFKHVENYEDVVDAVTKKEVDAGLTGAYYSDDKTRVILNFATSPFYFATNSNNTDIISELNRSIRSIKLKNPEYENTLKHKYLDTGYSYFTLTEAEKEFISSSRALKVSYTQGWAPYEDSKVNSSEEEFVGIVAKVFKKIEELTGFKFEYYPTEQGGGVIEGIELISSFESSVDRAYKQGYQITNPYLEVPVVLVKKDNNPNTNLKTAVSKYYYTADNLLEDTSLLKYYDTPSDCIDAIYNGEVEQAIVSSLFANNILDEFKYKSYYSIPLKSEKMVLSIGVREDLDPMILNILNKAIAYIDTEEIDNIIVNETIQNKKINIKSIYNNMSYDVVILILIILSIVIGILIYAIVNREKYLQKIKNILFYDSMTGLLSRFGFEKELRKLLNEDKNDYYIVYLNIINFTSYNLLNGRDRGNELIKDISSILKEDTDENLLSARIYADNFVFCLKRDNIYFLKDEIEKSITTHRYNLSKVTINAKLGVYKIIDKNISVSDMIDYAIIAERSIKNKHDANIAVYDSELHNESIRKDEIVSYFDTAIRNNEFLLYYQPKYNAFTEQIVGAEALVRWKRKDEIIPPNEFIPVLENRGKIAKLDFYMFEKVCIKQKSFIDMGVPTVPISVNFSRVNLYDVDLIKKLKKIINKYDIDPSIIEIEFTEGSLIDDIDSVSHVLKELKKMNFVISIDDFGSGYSSLNALKDLPVDVLKIDRGFITYNEQDDFNIRKKGELILRKIISLSKDLKMVTVVEGVEDKEQLEFLRECKCDIIQGYIFSRPLPEGDFDKLITRKPI